jgi:hypothetical protein
MEWLGGLALFGRANSAQTGRVRADGPGDSHVPGRSVPGEKLVRKASDHSGPDRDHDRQINTPRRCLDRNTGLAEPFLTTPDSASAEIIT